MTESNYEKTKHTCAKMFCQSDHTALIRRFNLTEDDAFIYLQFFQQPFRLSKKTGEIERLLRAPSNNWANAQFNEAMTIYDLLEYAQPACHAGKGMINIKSLHTKIATAAPSSNDFFHITCKHLEQHASVLQQAFESLGGTPLGKADASAQFTVIDDLNMQIHFYLADEDFPASLQLYWDENVLQYMHYETIWYASGFILEEVEAQCETQTQLHA